MNRFLTSFTSFPMGRPARLLLGLLLAFGSFRLTATPVFTGDPRKVKQATEAADALGAAQRNSVAAADAKLLVIDPAALAEAARLRVDRYVTTERLTEELATHLQVQINPVAVERLHLGIAHLLGTDQPAGFVPATADISTLQELATRHARALQQWLAPWLPQPAYDRYVALLDGWQVIAN